MSEAQVACATAQVMLYNDHTKSWDVSVLENYSRVEVRQSQHELAFRIVAIRLQDRTWTLDTPIHHRLKYHAARPNFHQWRDKKGQVYGLSFASESEARSFLTAVGQTIDVLIRAHEQQQNNQRPVAVAAGIAYNQQSSYQEHQQRSASQASSASSGHGLTVSVQSHPPLPTSSAPPSPLRVEDHVKVSPPFPQLQKSTVSSGPVSTAATVGSRAPPPPPPPLPPPGTLTAAGSGAPSLADQLKAHKAAGLRSVGNGATDGRTRNETVTTAATTIANNASNKPPTGGDLMSELQSRLRRKTEQKQEKTDAVSCGSTVSSDTGTTYSATAAPPPPPPPLPVHLQQQLPKKWSPTTNATTTTTTQQKSPPMDQPQISRGSAGASTGVTTETLERWKSELLGEVRAEITRARDELLAAMRDELQQVVLAVQQQQERR